MTASAQDDLERRARTLTAELPAPDWQADGVILVDDGGDGSAGARLMAGCHTIDPNLQMTVGSQTSERVALVLIVLDAGADTAAELAPIVVEHLRRYGRVALVCNRIDEFWQWPHRLVEYRERLDPLHLCPVFAVAADVAGDPASGMAALIDWLHEERNLVSDVAAQRARLTALATALTQLSVDEPDELRTRRAQLVACRDRGRTDRLAAARAGLTGARGSCAGRIHAWIRALTAQAVARAEAVSTRRDATALVDWLTATITETARVELAALDARIERIRALALLGIDAGPSRRTSRGTVDLAPRRLPRTGRVADDALVMVFGASTGLGVGRLVASQLADVGLAGAMSTMATVAVGLAMALWVVRTRRQAALRTALRSWVIDSCAEARSRIEHAMIIAINDAEPQVAAAIGRHYERLARRTEREVAALDARLRAVGEQTRTASSAAVCSREIAQWLART